MNSHISLYIFLYFLALNKVRECSFATFSLSLFFTFLNGFAGKPMAILLGGITVFGGTRAPEPMIAPSPI